ncbi:SDR family oxidoreductase [Slackia heliotrinireducens]|uniref:dTDP-4-dehydrorhamnose reductase n=1 Tax=Slackia heliotrinireducens (strain ATCC 29202 / DSM 20476 / NCTC 11029 / RHS 1) TaxID=471855 RepID=C7N5M9_SLAHD|nr:NAD(P)-dependent oxidoreductase [Slackia heliotrinireducens]ACV22214.1 dTDP-4-dehydrorhamnose reductase [Slackia heliotrinireducens DSM 20476]VEH00332.1 dTDP-4-dehydrorhamnose reductase [Slackia heliotrinireducens]
MTFGPKRVVWIAGATGRLGRSIEYHLDHDTYSIHTTDRELNVTNLDMVTTFAESYRPEFIINCAGIADKDVCAANPDEAYRVNALGARNLAVASHYLGATIIQISTDDVFRSTKPNSAPLSEFERTNPSFTYGKSKEAGEVLVRELNPRHVILRSSWIYTARKDDFLRMHIADAKAGREIEVPADQFGSPTSSDTFCKVLMSIMETGEYGTFHLSCEGLCSRYEFIKRALELAGASTVNMVGTYDPDKAFHVELDNMMIRLTGLAKMPSWKDDLEEYMRNHRLLG